MSDKCFMEKKMEEENKLINMELIKVKNNFYFRLI